VRWILITIFLTGNLFAQIKLTELGRFGGTGSAAGLFKNPSAIDIGEGGRIYICDRGNHRIQVFDLFGKFLTNFGGFGAGTERFDEPLDVWARSTINVYISDYNNQRVQRYNKDHVYLSSLYSNPGDDEKFQFERVLSAAYSPQGEMFILDESEYKVIKINPQNKGERAFAYYESGAGELITPVQIDLSSNHRVVVSDAGRRSINYYDYFGNFMLMVEHPDMKYPGGIALDNQNRLYVADSEAQSIFIFSPDHAYIGKITNVEGISLNRPADVALHKRNNDYILYIIDFNQIIIAKLNYNQAGE
jgi:DNA-binding beta-propeller fold protein YncE